MAQCYITRRGNKTSGGESTEQFGIYPIGTDGKPTGDVIVPNVVTSLSSSIFKENKNILSVTLKDTVSTLEASCFYNCSNLQRVKMSDNITTIPNMCFNNCTSLTEVNIPKSCTKINTDAFRTSGITLTEIPEGITILDQAAFMECNNLTEIHIPKSVTTIGVSCFKDCINLQNVTISDDAKFTLEDGAFSYDPILTDESAVNILKHTSTTYPRIFTNCTGLKNIKCPNLKLWTQMFYSCTGLISVEIGQGNTGDECFYNCTSLQSAILSEGITTIGRRIFNGCKALKTVYLPSSINAATSNSLTTTSTYDYILAYCTALEDVQLGQDWNMSLRLDVSNKITVDSMIAMFNALKDLTGDTAKTLTLGSVNLAKLTDEQKAIATNKNWTLA